ncbi:hypothetical protein GDO86_010685 [Hymenochirus boettgeri]|uniref:Uncharacterized protein n=1 Tax=Hymenochirus boettgeri TaxID=247094 RepID=A0A8T2JD78_9PIPI|nr:hypothetical protein GDO86_010685 [Hymenochirus boettgeri]
MCKLCNLFSPNHSELILHVSENHSEEELSAGDIIIPLRPLVASNKSTEDLSAVKRKRGRPKGSTKKLITEDESAEHSTNDISAETDEKQLSSDPASDNLECRKCSRTFSNVRQLKKHICIIVLNEDEDVSQGNEFEGKFIQPELERERQTKRPRLVKTDKSIQSKECEKALGVNPIVRVLLTAHEAIPGATKIIPIEAANSEAEPQANSQAVDQDQSQRKGYQEYAIPQTQSEQSTKAKR